MAATTACMGGWCLRRERCEHYVSTHRQVVVERLCEPGTFDAFEPLRKSAERFRGDPRFAAWVAGDGETT